MKRLLLGLLGIVCCVNAFSDTVVIGFASDNDFWTYPAVQKYLNSSHDTQVTFQSYAGGCKLLQAIQDGDVDIAYVDVPMLYQIQLYQFPFVTSATAVTRGRNDQGRVTYTTMLITKKRRSMVSIRNVSGKKVGIVPFSLSGEVIPEILLQRAGLLPGRGYDKVIMSSAVESQAALDSGSVDAIGYRLVLPLDSKKYDELSVLAEMPNSALVVAEKEKEKSSIKEVMALLNSIPKDSQLPGAGKVKRFADPQTSPYKYWLSQMAQSGLFHFDKSKDDLFDESICLADDSNDPSADASEPEPESEAKPEVKPDSE